MEQDGAFEREIQTLRKAKADLETLFDTSAVGVACFDGRTGARVSVNR